MTQPLKTIIPLFLGILVLLGYSYLGAQAPANPPSNNTSAPINTSPDPQVKDGWFGLDRLQVFSTSPTIHFFDEDVNATKYYLHANSNLLYILADRNGDGSGWDGSPHPLVLSASTSQSADYATFSNEVRATEFCNKSGDCLTLPSGASGPAVADVVRTKRLANAVGVLAKANAQSEWNGIINASYNNHPTQDAVATGIRDECRWQDAESHPTSGNVTAKETQDDILQGCASFVCSHHPSMDLGFNLKMSQAYHGGENLSTRGVYKIDCFY